VKPEPPADRPSDWPAVPYKGFSAYGPLDRRLFAGREEDITRFTRLVTDVGSRIVLLQGETGCGKSSFLRAGLIPHLEAKSRGFEFQKGDPGSSKTVFIRSTSDPLERLAEKVFEFVSRPYEMDTVAGTVALDLHDIVLDNQTKEAFTVRVKNDPQVLVDTLTALSAELPSTLVLIVDQAEEVLTLARREARQARQAFFDFLARFALVELPLKLIVTLRTEFFGRFLAYIRRSQGKPGELHDPLRDRFRDYLLDTLSDEALVKVIKHPTLRKPERDAAHDRYHFEFEPGLPERIVKDIGIRLDRVGLVGGALPVLQVIC